MNLFEFICYKKKCKVMSFNLGQSVQNVNMKSCAVYRLSNVVFSQ